MNRSHRPADPLSKAERIPAPEPPVCRWPHPVEDGQPRTEALLRCICTSLSYQNQMLADLCTLLERMELTLREGS